MRVPPFEQNPRLLQSAGLFLSGVVIGSALFMVMYHHNFNELIITNMTLRAHNEQLTHENTNNKKYMNNQTIVRSVQVHIEQRTGLQALDLITIKEIERKMKIDMNLLFVGQPIREVPELAQKTRGLLNRKLYSASNEKDYIFEVKTMLIINGNLEVWASAEEFKRN